MEVTWRKGKREGITRESKWPYVLQDYGHVLRLGMGDGEQVGWGMRMGSEMVAKRNGITAWWGQALTLTSLSFLSYILSENANIEYFNSSLINSLCLFISCIE